MLEIGRNSNLADEFWGEPGQQNEQLLARAFLAEVVKGAMRTPAGI